MPVSELQARVLREIAANRSPDSYLAGATVLHRAEDSPRFSQDLDIFHDLAEAVAVSAEADARTLRRGVRDLPVHRLMLTRYSVSSKMII